MSRIVTLAAGAVGFVLGSRAGRGPYEKLRAQADQVRRDPRVQEKVGQAQQVAAEKAKEAGQAAQEKAKDAASSLRSSDDSSAGSTGPVTGGGPTLGAVPDPVLDPDPTTPSSETVGQAGPGPQGTLP